MLKLQFYYAEMHHLRGVAELAQAIIGWCSVLWFLAGNCMGTTLKGLQHTAGGAQAPG